MNRIILGIDPGLTRTGWGIVRLEGHHLRYLDSGAITTTTKHSLPERLSQLYQTLKQHIQHHAPTEAAIEETFVNRNPTTSLKLGHARAACILAVSNAHIPLSEYSPNSVKKAIVGVGHAEKQQVYKMVAQLLPCVSFQNYDQTDALAVALCHYLTHTTLQRWNY